jgi:hypothetical protein
MIPSMCPINRRTLVASAAIVLLLVMMLQGCRRAPQGPLVHPVKGRVTLDGEPVAGVGVAFSPLVSGQGAVAYGTTLADGSYKLSSTLGGKRNAGAVAGDYAVLLQKFVDATTDALPPQHAAAPGDPGRTVQQWFSKSEGHIDNEGKVHYSLNCLPDAYGKAESSGLRVTVKPGVNDGPDFEFQLRRDYAGVRQNVTRDDVSKGTTVSR